MVRYVTGGGGKTLMAVEPYCSSFSCTSACGMQHLTHNPFSSFPTRQFIWNLTHIPCFLCMPASYQSPWQQASLELQVVHSLQAEGAVCCGLGCAFSKLFAVNLIPLLPSFPSFFPQYDPASILLPLMPSTTSRCDAGRIS